MWWLTLQYGLEGKSDDTTNDSFSTYFQQAFFPAQHLPCPQFSTNQNLQLQRSIVCTADLQSTMLSFQKTHGCCLGTWESARKQFLCFVLLPNVDRRSSLGKNNDGHSYCVQGWLLERLSQKQILNWSGIESWIKREKESPHSKGNYLPKEGKSSKTLLGEIKKIWKFPFKNLTA